MAGTTLGGSLASGGMTARYFFLLKKETARYFFLFKKEKKRNKKVLLGGARLPLAA